MRVATAVAGLLALAACAGVTRATDPTEGAARCSITGFGHVMTFDNQREESPWAGVYTLTRSKDGFLDSTLRRRPLTRAKPEVVVVRDVAVRCAQDLVEFLVIGGEPDGTTAPRVEVHYNGTRLPLVKGDVRTLAHFPDATRHASRPGLLQLRVDAMSATVVHFSLECNKFASSEEPGNFEFSILYKIDGTRVFADVDVAADPHVYGDGNMAGLCGWRSDAEDAAMQAHQCLSKKFESDACMALVTRTPDTGLFRDKAAVQPHGERFVPLFDVHKLQELRAGCQQKLSVAAPSQWVSVLPADIQLRLSTFVSDCAVDAYFGLTHELGMRICADVASRVGDIRARIAENFASVRCMFAYDNSLFINGTVSFRMAMEEYMARLDVDRHRLHLLCSGPCPCPASPLEPASPNNLACKDLPQSWADELLVRIGRKHPIKVQSTVSTVSGVPPPGVATTAPLMKFRAVKASLMPADN